LTLSAELEAISEAKNIIAFAEDSSLNTRNDSPPTGFLLRKFWLVAISILICCSVLAAPALRDQWLDFVQGRRAVAQLALFKAGLEAARAISAERGPTNGLLGQNAADQADWRTRLNAARVASDDAIRRFETALADADRSDPRNLIAKVAEVAAALNTRRNDVDALVALPQNERPPLALEQAVDAMVALIPALMMINRQIGNVIIDQDRTLADEVAVAQQSSALREYAGQLGSQLVIALFRGQGFSSERLRKIDRLEGRVNELHDLINGRLVSYARDSELTAIRAEIDDLYFKQGLDLIEGLRAAEMEKAGASGASAGSFTERYVPEMKPIEALFDLMLARAAAGADAERATASIGLASGSAVVVAIFALLGVTGLMVHRHIVRPLTSAIVEINALAAGRFESMIPEGRYFGEIRDVVQAVAVLRGASLHRRRLGQERETLLREVKRLADTDHLTGLFNRRIFEIVGSDALRRGEGMAIILFDIDHFKQINDRFGHEVGDKVIRAVALRLENAVRESDAVFRYGGEEFAAIVRSKDAQLFPAVAERLRVSVSGAPVIVDGDPLAVTISAGIAHNPRGETEIDLPTLVKRADQALYRAKRDGRDRVSV
jgi:diguanylate cyclase (GGDEF)-like protein